MSKANDQLANYIAQYPNRFVGFATLPINEPEAAAREFERCINDLDSKVRSLWDVHKMVFLIKTNMTLFSKS